MIFVFTNYRAPEACINNGYANVKKSIAMITNSNHKQAENTQNIKTRKTNLLKDYVKKCRLV